MNSNTKEALFKVCSKCKIEKEANTNYFSRHKGRKYGLASQCKECRKKLDAERYKREKESILEQKKKYYKENKEKVKARQNNYYYNNIDDCKRREREWRKSNPHVKRTINERRITRERELSSTLTPEEWIQTKVVFGNSCAYCGMSEQEHLELNGELLHQEHFIPLMSGGTHERNNILPSCRSCNSSKLNYKFEDWYPNWRHYDEKRENKILIYLSTC